MNFRMSDPEGPCGAAGWAICGLGGIGLGVFDRDDEDDDEELDGRLTCVGTGPGVGGRV